MLVGKTFGAFHLFSKFSIMNTKYLRIVIREKERERKKRTRKCEFTYALALDYEVICTLMTLKSMSRKIKAQATHSWLVVPYKQLSENTKCSFYEPHRRREGAREMGE